MPRLRQLLPGWICSDFGRLRSFPRESWTLEHPRGAALVPALQSRGRSGHSQRVALCLQRLFSSGLPCFQVTLLPAHADGWMGAGILGERWVWGPAGFVPPLRSCCGTGRVWGGEAVHLPALSRRWARSARGCPVDG